MAYYATLISVMQSLENINSRDEYPNLLLDKKRIASVYESLSHLQALMEDWSPKDEAVVHCLERRIRDIACQVQYVLESQDIFESKLSYLIPQRDKTHGVEIVLRRLLIAKWKREMPQQLQDIEKVKEEADSIVKQVMTMKITKGQTTEDLKLINYYSASKQEPTRSGDTIVGFEEQLTTLKDQLCGGSYELETVPLVGMGGIGKTTLARSIFNDGLIKYHFDCRAWVTVSQVYHLQKLLLDVLHSMNVNTKKLSGTQEQLLAEYIYKRLKGRRYLIIMDDIWDTKVWDDMKRIFPNDSNGSRIILTTRLSDVAVYANRHGSFHQMKFLDEDQSWHLLREKVFFHEKCPQQLEVIGRLIAKNCRGLPLAIVVIAGLLSKVSKAGNEWEEIARNLSSTITENDEHFSKILSLSYNQLPHHLKPCLLYIGSFPKNYQIPISKLIKLWVAEGFLKPNEFKSLEELGEEYLEDLVKRNLVLITKKKSDGKFKSCSIHDILRDLCMKRACYEGFLHVVEDDDDYLFTEGTRNIVRRLCILPARSRLKEKEFGSHAGSILCFRNTRKFLLFAPGFKLLRVLDAREVRFISFPVEVLKLSRLKYLALGRWDRSKFNISLLLTKLENLQTLIVGSAKFSQILTSPFQIWKMPNLRHLTVGILELSSPIPFACILENLQTLSRVANFRFTNRAIQMIPNLKTLKVLYTSGTWEKFCLYNLVQLCQLEKLDIRFFAKDPPFPENFAFPQKLRKLTLEGCCIPWKDTTVVGCLPNLQALKLRDDAFVGDEWEPIEGEFTRLKFLQMDGLNLKYWRADSTNFPCLEHLQISFCKELEEIPPEIGNIPTLELIEVYFSKLAEASAMKLQEDQQESGNDILRVFTLQSKFAEASAMKLQEDQQESGNGILRVFTHQRNNFTGESMDRFGALLHRLKQRFRGILEYGTNRDYAIQVGHSNKTLFDTN